MSHLFLKETEDHQCPFIKLWWSSHIYTLHIEILTLFNLSVFLHVYGHEPNIVVLRSGMMVSVSDHTEERVIQVFLTLTALKAQHSWGTAWSVNTSKRHQSKYEHPVSSGACGRWRPHVTFTAAQYGLFSSFIHLSDILFCSLVAD